MTKLLVKTLFGQLLNEKLTKRLILIRKRKPLIRSNLKSNFEIRLR